MIQEPLILFILIAFLIYEILSIRETTLRRKTKVMGYTSNLLVTVYIYFLLFQEISSLWMISLLLASIPAWIYFSYLRFKEHRKATIVDFTVLAIMLVVIWFYA